MMDTVSAFRQVIERDGLTPPNAIIPDGEIHRFSSNGDRDDDAGWYVLHDDGMPAGMFGCWRSNLKKNWCAKSDTAMTETERAEYRQRLAAIRRQRDADEQRRHAEAATRAQTIWDQATPAPEDHPYLQKKRIQPHGLRVDDLNRLIVPVTIDGVLSSLQFIDVDSTKKFVSGGEVKGGSFMIGELTGAKTITIVEGFATGASLCEATGYPVGCAFSAGNLRRVAEQLRQHFPTATIVLAGDNDIRDDGKPNVGLDAATAAADAINGVLAIPDAIDSRKTDWNDVHVQRGLDAVKEAIMKRTQKPEALAGAIRPDRDREEELARLAMLSPAAYGMERQAASDRLGIPLGFLDAEREARRKAEKKAEPGQGREIEFEDIPPASEPVNGADLGERLAAIFTKFAVLPSHGAETLALWVLFTYCYDRFEIAPRIDLRSPEKQCGKTTVLGLLRRLAWRALLSSNITPSTIFRVVSAHTPTLLIDEMDTFTDANEELRGILNSGHTRDGATVIRNVGEQHEPRTFSTWAPMAFAHIGRIPDTLEDRSICIPMKRKIARERIASLRQVGPAAAALRLDLRTLIGQIVRWIADEGPRLAGTEPPVLEGLSDRANDNWAPLLSLAEVLGGLWPSRTREAALAFSGPAAMDHESVKVELLADIRNVYARQGVDRLSSTDLCDRLTLLEERPWGTWKHGKPLTPVQLARLLHHFNISSRNLRLETGVVKGYCFEDFNDAFERYIPSPFPDPTTSNRYTATTRVQSGDHPLFQSATEGVCSVSENGLNPAPRVACSAVADQNGVAEGEETIDEEIDAH